MCAVIFGIIGVYGTCHGVDANNDDVLARFKFIILVFLFPESKQTQKGHMQGRRQGVRSTKPAMEEE